MRDRQSAIPNRQPGSPRRGLCAVRWESAIRNPQSAMRILVTGAAGFAGSHLVELLLTTRADVIAWHRPGSSIPVASERVRWEAVDMLDRKAVGDRIARDRPETVYHC